MPRRGLPIWPGWELDLRLLPSGTPHAAHRLQVHPDLQRYCIVRHQVAEECPNVNMRMKRGAVVPDTRDLLPGSNRISRSHQNLSDVDVGDLRCR